MTIVIRLIELIVKNSKSEGLVAEVIKSRDFGAAPALDTRKFPEKKSGELLSLFSGNSL